MSTLDEDIRKMDPEAFLEKHEPALYARVKSTSNGHVNLEVKSLAELKRGGSL
jgi:hypothetical protein